MVINAINVRNSHNFGIKNAINYDNFSQLTFFVISHNFYMQKKSQKLLTIFEKCDMQ